MKVSKKKIKEKLLAEFGIWTKATSMGSGSHEWWFKDNKIHCYGSGQNWRDQNDETTLSLDEAVEHIYRNLEITGIELSHQ